MFHSLQSAESALKAVFTNKPRWPSAKMVYSRRQGLRGRQHVPERAGRGRLRGGHEIGARARAPVVDSGAAGGTARRPRCVHQHQAVPQHCGAVSRQVGARLGSAHSGKRLKASRSGKRLHRTGRQSHETVEVEPARSYCQTLLQGFCALAVSFRLLCSNITGYVAQQRQARPDIQQSHDVRVWHGGVVHMQA